MSSTSRRPHRFVWFSPGRSAGWYLALAGAAAVPVSAGWFGHALRLPALIPHAAQQALKNARATVETPSEASAPDQERMDRLSSALKSMVHAAPAHAAAVYVQDIETGLTASANPNQPFLAASLIKVPVMATAFEVWQAHPERKTSTAKLWLEQMITVSDNASTDHLIDLVGGPEVVTRFCEEHGWPHLLVHHAILNHRGRHGLNLCTAREMTELMVALDERKLVGEEADQEMWAVLCRQKKRHRIPEGLPHLPDLQVGNKTGTLGNALHDAGIVHTANGRYAICILVAGQRSDASAEKWCRKVSRLVFDALHGPVPPPVSVARGT